VENAVRVLAMITTGPHVEGAAQPDRRIKWAIDRLHDALGWEWPQDYPDSVKVGEVDRG
jgi:hypothetical protein